MTQDLLGQSPLWADKPIIDRLIDRYGITDRPTGSNAVLIPRQVQLISDADELLRDSSIWVSLSIDPTAGAKYQTMLTVAAGQRRIITNYAVSRTVGANLTHSEMRFLDADGVTIGIDAWTAAASQVAPVPAAPITLEQGWVVQIYVVAYNAGDEMQLKMLTKLEDAHRS